MQSLLVLMIVVLFLLTLKSILSTCPCVTLIHDEALKDSVYVLFREVVFVACGALII